MKIFCGNCPFSTTEQDLVELFSQHGHVASAKIITDRESGQSRGFGFIEMPNDQEAESAIAALNGHKLDGRRLNVNEARPMERREQSGGRR